MFLYYSSFYIWFEYMNYMFILIILCLDNTAAAVSYTLSLHDALPIFGTDVSESPRPSRSVTTAPETGASSRFLDRKSTRLNSSHLVISYAVFCLKKNKNMIMQMD